MKDNEQYYAFISYSHKDKKWGNWLHKKLESYKIPKDLVGTESRGGRVPKRLFPVFRDREELPTATDLSQVISDALGRSKFLIVICSPNAAASKWVNEEILAFKRSGRSNKILALIVDGEPNADDKRSDQKECFPEALKYEIDTDGQLSVLRTEPIAGDAREEGDGKNNALIKLVAGVLGVGFDTLKKRDETKRRHTRMVWGCVTVSLFLVLSLLTGWALQEKKNAEHEQSIAISASQESKIAKDKAEESLSQANHNYGLTLLSQSEKAEKNNDSNSAYLFAQYANRFILSKADTEKTLARTKIDNNKAYPIIFRTTHHNSLHSDICFSPDGKTLASTSTDGAIFLWDRVTGNVKSTTNLGLDPESKIACSSDGQTLAANRVSEIVLFDIRSETVQHTLTGHLGAITSLVFSPDGTLLASGAEESEIFVWDVKNGNEIKKLGEDYHTGTQSLVFSPDGKTLAAGYTERQGDLTDITFWDIASWQARDTWRTDSDAINSMAYSPDGNFFASASNNSLTLWDVRQGNRPKILFGKPPDGHEGSSGDYPEDILSNNPEDVYHGDENLIHHIAFSPDGTTLASSTENQSLLIWDVNTGKIIITLKDKARSSVKKTIYSPDGKTLMSLADHGSLVVWDAKTNKSQVDMSGQTRVSNSLSFSPDGKLIAFNDEDNNIILMDVQSGKEKKVLQNKSTEIFSLVFFPDSKSLIASSKNGPIVIWDVQTGTVKRTLKIENWKYDMASDKSVTVSTDGKELAISSPADGSIIIFDLETGEIVNTINVSHKKILTSLFKSSVGMLFTVEEDGKLFGWPTIVDDDFRVMYQDFLKDFNIQNKKDLVDIDAATFNGDGVDGVVMGSGQKIIMKKPNGELLSSQNTHWINCLSVSPDRKTIVSGSSDGTIILWDNESLKQKTILNGHTGSISALSYSPDGKILVSSSSRDNSIVFWDMESGGTTLSEKPYVGRVTCATYSPDGATLALGDGSLIVLRKINSGQIKKTLSGHSESVTSIAYSPNGQFLASGSKDRLIVWEIKDDDYNQLANLTDIQSIENLLFMSDGKTLIAGTTTETLSLDIDNGLLLNSTIIASDDGQLSYSPVKQLLAIRHFFRVSFYDLKNKNMWGSFEYRGDGRTGIAFSPDGNMLSIGDGDGVLLWDVNREKKLLDLSGAHSDKVNSVAYSPDGKILASASKDGTIALWNTKSGRRVTTLKIPSGAAIEVIFSPNNKTLTAISDLSTNFSILEGEKMSHKLLSEVNIFNLEKMSNNLGLSVEQLEQQHRLQLKGVDLVPQPLALEELNLYSAPFSPPSWPESHPFH